MRIIFLEAVQNYGGARKSTVELASVLKNNGNEVIIIDLWGSCTPFVEEVNRLDLPIKFLDKREDPIILFDADKFKMIKNYFNYFFKWFGYRKAIREEIKVFKPDLIVVNNTKVLSILKKTKQYKIVLFARGWLMPNTVSNANRFLFNRFVDLFIGVSQATRQAIFAGGLAKLDDIYVVPNAIDLKSREHELLKSEQALKAWDLESSDRPFTILHCGGFLESKGQLIVLEIAKELKKLGVDFKIMLVGIVYKGGASDLYLKKIINEIEKHNLLKQVEIILNKPNAEEYFVQTDILIHPSFTEGLPRVVMEAMYFGKPVIANAVGGVTDFILHNFTGYLTNYNNVGEYVEYILKLKSDKDIYTFISKNSKDLIKHSYTTENQYRSFMKIDAVKTNTI